MATRSKNKPAKRRRNKKKKFDTLSWLIGGGIVLLIALPIAVNLIRESQLPGQRFRNQGHVHISLGTKHPPYNSNPPTSGWHTPDIAAWGSYDYVLPDERLVHNMEDAGVVFWYKMGTPEENAAHIEKLEAAIAEAERLTRQTYRRVIIVPRENLDTTYAMTAWRRLQTFDAIDPAQIGAFLKAYEGIDNHPR